MNFRVWISKKWSKLHQNWPMYKNTTSHWTITPSGRLLTRCTAISYYTTVIYITFIKINFWTCFNNFHADKGCHQIIKSNFFESNPQYQRQGPIYVERAQSKHWLTSIHLPINSSHTHEAHQCVNKRNKQALQSSAFLEKMCMVCALTGRKEWVKTFIGDFSAHKCSIYT